MLRLRSAIFVAAAALALVPAAGGGVARPVTTEPVDIVDVHVTITDTRITLTKRSLPRGYLGRFIVRNLGRKQHSFAFDVDEKPGTGLTGLIGDLSTGTLRHGQRKTLLVFLDYRGIYIYGSTVPADTRKPGMNGHFTVV